MNPIVETVYNYWQMGRQTKSTPGGWISGNACCCIHNGESQDTRKRGGILLSRDSGVVYSCFNCGFSTGWHPGMPFGHKLKKLLTWMNVPDDTITKLQFYALGERDQMVADGTVVEYPTFPTIDPPKGMEYIAEAKEVSDGLTDVLEYMASRNLHEIDYPFAWGKGGDHRNRLVIPAFYHGNLVGFVSRDISGKSRYRYIKEVPQGFIFNLDHQNQNRELVFVCEGNLDALYIDGVATMGSEITDQQRLVLNSLGKTVVVVPDRDNKGRHLVEQAIDNEWGVAFPDWDPDVKDIGDAALKYGRLYTLYSIAESIHFSKFKIQVKSKLWFGS